jgi:hypothetical protein
MAVPMAVPMPLYRYMSRNPLKQRERRNEINGEKKIMSVEGYTLHDVKQIRKLESIYTYI